MQITQSVAYQPGVNMPSKGDIFILNQANGQRGHVGFIYDIKGDVNGFQWKSAEGGQGQHNAQTMWRYPDSSDNDKWRGPEADSYGLSLAGWHTLSSYTRDKCPPPAAPPTPPPSTTTDSTPDTTTPATPSSP